MSQFFYRVFVFLMVFITTVFSAQKISENVSDGTLQMNDGTNIPVKIFATTSGQAFVDFGSQQHTGNTLIFLNDEMKEYVGSPIFEVFKKNGYQLLDKKFNPIALDAVSDPKDYAYYYKPENAKTVVTPGTVKDLKTEFKIWNPSKGLKLGPITLHFYSLMFILAFGLGYFIMAKMFKIDNVNEKYLEPLFTWTLVGTIFGARLGHVIFYEPELFKTDFWSVFLPIRTQPKLEFTGFSGLASHGAAIALILTTLYYSLKIIKKNPFWVYDRIGIVVALGGAFVRMGNFFNSEIIGKAVAPSSPFAMLFPQQSYGYGATVPRYPTQLFEAVGYLLLFILLWFLYRKTDKKYQQGWLFGLFFIILWGIRFFVEFLKEPQDDEFITFVGLNTGQILSIPFMIAGAVIMWYSQKNKITEAENEKPE